MNVSNIKFDEIPSTGRRAHACERTDILCPIFNPDPTNVENRVSS